MEQDEADLPNIIDPESDDAAGILASMDYFKATYVEKSTAQAGDGDAVAEHAEVEVPSNS